jgi:uncharacterized membrane protein YqjE
MDPSPFSMKQLTSATKQLARRLLPIGANRIELIMLELQEARMRFLQLLLLVCGIILCGLLASMTLTALVVTLFWEVAPIAVLIALTVTYLASGFFLWRRLSAAAQNVDAFNATRSQFRKDRAALTSFIS